MEYALISWTGTFPRPTGKGVVVLTGINLIQFEIDRHTIYIKIDAEGKQFIRNKDSPSEIATNKLLTYLKNKHHKEFKFMNVTDLTVR